MGQGLQRVPYRYYMYIVHPYIYTLLGCLFVCPFVSNTRQISWTKSMGPKFVWDLTWPQKRWILRKIYFRKILDYIHQHKIINPQNLIIVSSNDQATITSLSIRWYLYNLVCVYIYFYIFACKGYPQ